MTSSDLPRRRWKNRRPDLDREAARYFVYRLIDGAGQCLYIGRSCDPLQRLKAHHATGAEWPTRVLQIEVTGTFTWDEAVRAERDAILRERPPYNIDGVTKKTGRRIGLAS